MTDRGSGILRHGSPKRFRYIGPNGAPVRDPKTLERIRSLVIPPAWKDVWISVDPRGHLQATGRDARGRKQHRYHPRWRQVRDEAKYDRMVTFATLLPRLRRRAATDLALSGLPRQKVLAALVQLLERTLIRVGNDEYARDNQSFGLTTIRDSHARISGETIRFRFKGKSGKFHDISFADARLARIVRRCRELPGDELFQYLDDQGQVVDVGSADVNDYIRGATGDSFTAKDIRTWAGTVLAARALGELGNYSSQPRARRNVLCAVDAVAAMLGNTRSVCRKSYIHPAVVNGYLDGSLIDDLGALVRSGRRGVVPFAKAEAVVLEILQRSAEPKRKTA